MNTFAQRLRYTRTQRGFTQEKLALLSGLSQSAIASYESGLRHQTRNLLCLAKALNVNPLWLEQGLGPMNLTVQEIHKNYNPSWPFTQISLEDFNALTTQDQRLIENVILSVMDHLKEHKNA